MCTVGTINRQTTLYVELSLLLSEVELMVKLKGKLVQNKIDYVVELCYIIT